jgi:hypothetical protein
MAVVCSDLESTTVFVVPNPVLFYFEMQHSQQRETAKQTLE